MSTGILSYPFRLSATGEAATVGRGSDDEVREAIEVLISTRVGERLLSPEFGTPDPVYAGLSAGGVQLGLDEYGPEGISVDEVRTTQINDTEAEAVVRWSRTIGETL